MKKLILIILAFISIQVHGQTDNNTSTRFTNGLGAPNKVTAPFIGEGFLWWQSGKLAVSNGTVWQNLLTETLAGTTYVPQARTITINGVTFDLSSNRTWTIPVVTTTVDGLMSFSDKVKLNAITGTNTGNQTLSLGATPGNIIISAGNNVTLTSIGTNQITDGSAVPASAGLLQVSHTTGSTGYPGVFGSGIRSVRGAGSPLGAFEIDVNVSVVERPRIRYGLNSTTWSAFETIMTKEYGDALYSPLSSIIKRGTGVVAPSSATDTGVKDEVRLVGGFLYWCTATNTWVRSPLTTW